MIFTEIWILFERFKPHICIATIDLLCKMSSLSHTYIVNNIDIPDKWIILHCQMKPAWLHIQISLCRHSLSHAHMCTKKFTYVNERSKFLLNFSYFKSFCTAALAFVLACFSHIYVMPIIFFFLNLTRVLFLFSNVTY